jgi:hypothetical protein
VVGGGGVHGRKVLLLYIQFRATCAKLLPRAVLVILSKNAVSSYVQLPTATSRRVIKCFQVTVRHCTAGVPKSRTPYHSRDYILCGGANCWWVFSVELAVHNASGVWNFIVIPRYSENLCTPAIRYHFRIYPHL